MFNLSGVSPLHTSWGVVVVLAAVVIGLAVVVVGGLGVVLVVVVVAVVAVVVVVVFGTQFKLLVRLLHAVAASIPSSHWVQGVQVLSFSLPEFKVKYSPAKHDAAFFLGKHLSISAVLKVLGGQGRHRASSLFFTASSPD